MTVKMYYENVNLEELRTNIVKSGTTETEERYYILEETIFYPTGGGQPNDTGWINEVEVYNVEEVDGEIRHFVKEEITETEVSCKINKKRRFDHMQQHAGQHILSATFENYFNLKTVSFHLGEKICTIDIDAEEIEDSLLRKVEKLANEIIIENRPIITKWVTKEQADQLPLRKALSVDEDIRLVIIPDYDYNGCGGTHPTFTGQVMGIKIISTEKMKQKTRVSFICGHRILDDLHKKTEIMFELQKTLNAPEEKLVEAANRLLVSEKEKVKTVELLKEQLLNHQLDKIVANENSTQVIVMENEPMATLQKLAKKCVTERQDLTISLLSKLEETIQFVNAKGNESNSNKSMKELNQLLISETSGKGGGNDLFAQGGGKWNQDILILKQKIENWLLV